MAREEQDGFPIKVIKDGQQACDPEQGEVPRQKLCVTAGTHKQGKLGTCQHHDSTRLQAGLPPPRAEHNPGTCSVLDE